MAASAVVLFTSPSFAMPAGSAWTIQTSPAPPEATSSQLSSVACPAARSCFAVGWWQKVGVQHVLAERWDGTGWSVSPTPDPPGALTVYLMSVACPTRRFCVAAGYYQPDRSTSLALAEQWDGSSWSIVSTPLPTGGQSGGLGDVSCSSATSCVALGGFVMGSTHETFAEMWNGSSWLPQTVPVPAGGALLSGISCPNAKQCTAVGAFWNGSVQAPLAERWDGTSWSIETLPAPSGWTQDLLGDVSCWKTGCVAVGTAGNSTGSTSLTERLTGGVWSLETAPMPPGLQWGALAGVVCPKADRCVAVGTYLVTQPSEWAIAERWNGSVWTVESTPNPPGAQGDSLSGIGCSSATLCTAVGSFSPNGGTPGTLVERRTA